MKGLNFKNLCYFIFLAVLPFTFISSTQKQVPLSHKKYVVAQNNLASSDDNPGTEAKPFKTISKAAALAEPGDTVFVYGGIYREWVAPAS